MTVKKITQFVIGGGVAFTLAACAATPTKEGTGAYFDDTVLTAKVKIALFKDPTVSGPAVNAETFKGVVQLSGFVRTTAERDPAHVVTHEVAGARQIKNDSLIG